MKIQKIIFTVLILETIHIKACDPDEDLYCMSFVKDVLVYFKFIPKKEIIQDKRIHSYIHISNTQTGDANILEILLESISTKKLSIQARLQAKKTIDGLEKHKNQKRQAALIVVQDPVFSPEVRYSSLKALEQNHSDKLSRAKIEDIQNAINESWGSKRADAFRIVEKMIDHLKNRNSKKKK